MKLSGLFGRKRAKLADSLDEFLDDGDDREASPFDLAASSRRWQERVARVGTSRARAPEAAELRLPAFTLIRDGDLFEHPKEKSQRPTSPDLITAFADEQIRLVANRCTKEEQDAALAGILRVLSGNPALCKRMMLAKPIDLVLIPKEHDFRQHGFPRHTNPRAAGIFWNSSRDERAMLGLRQERILVKPWLMVHEMAHAVHFLALTKRERQDIEKYLLPVYRNRRWVEEAVAIYAECAFGAEYGEDELSAPGLYGKTRRDWHDQHVFSLFIAEMMRPNAAET